MNKLLLTTLSVLALAGCGQKGPRAVAVHPSPALVTAKGDIPIEIGSESVGSESVGSESVEREAAIELARETQIESPTRLDIADTENVIRHSAKVVSGAEPRGRRAFEALAAAGIQTIISVDGAAPDVESAEQSGLRYVHIPLQYSTISRTELSRLAKSFRELPAPFYVHCFHGHHRGPTAAAIGRIVIDGADRARALGEMYHWSRASTNYGGLYEVVAASSIPSAVETAALDWDFPARHTFEGFRGAMVEVARRFDHLERFSNNAWSSIPSHPDLNAAAESRQLVNALRSCAASPRGRGLKAFASLFDDSVDRARELEKILAIDKPSHSEADDAFAKLRRTCHSCHVDFRN